MREINGIFLCVWITSFNIMFSRFFHFLENVLTSFSFIAEEDVFVRCTIFSLSIYLSIGIYVGSSSSPSRVVQEQSWVSKAVYDEM